MQNVVKQAFTEKTASGTELTIDNTIEARMEMKLNGNTSQNGEPTPATPQEIHCVKGNNVVKVTNQNLFDESEEYPINLGSLELCKIGDYQDYIYKKDNKWYKHKAINKNTLNGNEKWFLGRTKTNYTTLFTNRFQNDIKIPANNNINSNTLIYCDKFSNNTNADQQWLNDTMSSVTINNGKNITFNIPNSIATTKDEFETYLISNNITLYYVLSTPIEEEITDTTLITQLDEISQALSKKGTTIISQSNDDLPFNLDVIALTK